MDDDEDIRRLIEFTLTESGYSVELAKTGKEALDLLEEFRPAAIVLDVVMPDMDGFKFFRKIKSMPDFNNIPVIFSTGKSGLKDYFELEDEELKPDAFISKPFKKEELVETVRGVL